MFKRVRKWVDSQVDTYKKAWDIAKAQADCQCGEFEKARPVFEKFAAQGISIAQFELAQMYANGHGVTQDDTRAFQLYKDAAIQGDAKAQMACGACYLEGKGVAANPVQALYWFEKVAERGAAPAQDLCGEFYFRGIGTEKDTIKALHWSEKAAKQGELDSQLRCVKIYSYGNRKDLTRAEQWLHTAFSKHTDVSVPQMLEAHLGLFVGWGEELIKSVELEDDEKAEVENMLEVMVTGWHQLLEDDSFTKE